MLAPTAPRMPSIGHRKVKAAAAAAMGVALSRGEPVRKW